MERFREIDALAALDKIVPGWDKPAGQQALPELRLIVTAPEPGDADGRHGSVTLRQLEQDAGPDVDAELAAASPGAKPAPSPASATTPAASYPGQNGSGGRSW
jgi:hypothetical protein